MNAAGPLPKYELLRGHPELDELFPRDARGRRWPSSWQSVAGGRWSADHTAVLVCERCRSLVESAGIVEHAEHCGRRRPSLTALLRRLLKRVWS